MANVGRNKKTYSMRIFVRICHLFLCQYLAIAVAPDPNAYVQKLDERVSDVNARQAMKMAIEKILANILEFSDQYIAALRASNMQGVLEREQATHQIQAKVQQMHEGICSIAAESGVDSIEADLVSLSKKIKIEILSLALKANTNVAIPSHAKVEIIPKESLFNNIVSCISPVNLQVLVLITDGSESYEKEMNKNDLWRVLYESARTRFRYQLEFVIKTVKNLIRDKAKKFEISVIESKKRIKSLSKITNQLPKNEKAWEITLETRFQIFFWEHGNVDQAEYLELLVQDFAQIDWNEYGKGVFNRIKTIYSEVFEPQLLMQEDFISKMKVGINNAESPKLVVKMNPVLQRIFKKLLAYFEKLVPEAYDQFPLNEVLTADYLHIHDEAIRQSCNITLERLITAHRKRILLKIVHINRASLENFESFEKFVRQPLIGDEWTRLFAGMRNTLVMGEQRTRIHWELAKTGHVYKSIISLNYAYVVMPFLVPHLLELVVHTKVTYDAITENLKSDLFETGGVATNQVENAFRFTDYIYNLCDEESSVKPKSTSVPLKSILKIKLENNAERMNAEQGSDEAPLPKKKSERGVKIRPNGLDWTITHRLEDELTRKWIQVNQKLRQTYENQPSISAKDIVDIQISFDNLISFTNDACRGYVLEIIKSYKDKLPEFPCSTTNVNI